VGAGRVFGAMVFAVISSLTSGAVSAQSVPTGEITEYGLYTIVNGKPALEQKTTRVPARKGVRFGFCADLAGLTDVDGKAMLSELVRHPVLTQPNGVETNGWNAPHMVSVMNGRGHWCGGHELRNDWQLVPGKWRFVVTDGVRDIVVQEFDVVADER
jgi:hypothetical protein